MSRFKSYLHHLGQLTKPLGLGSLNNRKGTYNGTCLRLGRRRDFTLPGLSSSGTPGRLAVSLQVMCSLFMLGGALWSQRDQQCCSPSSPVITYMHGRSLIPTTLLKAQVLLRVRAPDMQSWGLDTRRAAPAASRSPLQTQDCPHLVLLPDGALGVTASS